MLIKRNMGVWVVRGVGERRPSRKKATEKVRARLQLGAVPKAGGGQDVHVLRWYLGEGIYHHEGRTEGRTGT